MNLPQTETPPRGYWKIAPVRWVYYRHTQGHAGAGRPLSRVSTAAADTIGRDRDIGANFMSAEIIRFIPRPKHGREQTDFPTIAFRSAVRPDDPVTDHADTAPCEYVALDPRET
jgi:hypothetical protein